MRRVLQRLVLLAVCAAAIAVFGLQDKVALAQTGNWSYRPDLGGYLDVNTGLVWAEQSSYGVSTWNNIADNYLPNLRASTGFPWRMPTVVESQGAAAHGISAIVPVLRTCWTSDAKNKGGARFAHYAVSMYSGEANLFNNGSLIDFIAVYRP